MTRTGLLVAATVIALDQITKVLAVAFLSDRSIHLVGDVVQLRLTRNPGAAFSSFLGGGSWLAVVAALVAVVIAALLARIPSPVERFALALVMGGALGNFADRIFRGPGILDGAVVDFFDLSFWPTFNVADSAISVGIVLLIALSLWGGERAREPTEPVVGREPVS